MIKHIVMWQLKEEAAGRTRAGNARLVKAWLEACRDAIPDILCFDAVLTQEGMAASCDVMLYAAFPSRAALEAYLAHPLHQRLKQRMAPLCDARHCFDYEV
ncbi:Dabb family protein [Massilia sp. DWR3-1-1]|uniref:Dabb family protein n=1 Tax=Massilia sp. DWR3-1-1 TaxID=2804559 RepID=UPI003CEA3BAE